jgi:hypothetical protein
MRTFSLILGFLLFPQFAFADIQSHFESSYTVDRYTFSSEKRFVGKCGEENQYFRYERKGNDYIEVCNEPDREVFGIGSDLQERTQNYINSLKEARKKFPEDKIVLGGLSGYNYKFLKEFLSYPEACSLFDVYNFHPYHFGVAPDELDTEKDSWHTVEQWTLFTSEILKDAVCENKELWVTEMGYSLSGKDAEVAVSEDEQLSYVLRQKIILLSLGASKIAQTSDESFALSARNKKLLRNVENILNGSTFVSYSQDGDSYCPYTSQCFYTENNYRADTGKIIYGLREAPQNQKIRQIYTFKKLGGTISVWWNRGDDKIFLDYGRLKIAILEEDKNFYTRIQKMERRKRALKERVLRYKKREVEN